jgi:hypothetical protein
VTLPPEQSATLAAATVMYQQQQKGHPAMPFLLLDI